MSETYFVIHNSEGDTRVEKMGKEELVRRITPEDGCTYYGVTDFLKAIVNAAIVAMGDASTRKDEDGVSTVGLGCSISEANTTSPDLSGEITVGMPEAELIDRTAKYVANKIGHGMAEKCEKQAALAIEYLRPHLRATKPVSLVDCAAIALRTYTPYMDKEARTQHVIGMTRAIQSVFEAKGIAYAD